MTQVEYELYSKHKIQRTAVSSEYFGDIWLCYNGAKLMS